MQQDFNRLMRILDMRKDSDVSQMMDVIGLEPAIMLAAMGNTFTRRQLVCAGALSGTGARNVDRIIAKMVDNGVIVRVGNGVYEKSIN